MCATLTLSILFWLKYNTMSQIIQVYSLLYKILYKLSIIAYKCTKCAIVTSVELFTLNNDSLRSHYFNDPRILWYAGYLNYRNGSRDINRHAPKKMQYQFTRRQGGTEMVMPRFRAPLNYGYRSKMTDNLEKNAYSFLSKQ